jgi:hypothetical protein
MLDWNTGDPNPRYWVMRLIHGNFGPGDTPAEGNAFAPWLEVQGFVSRSRKHKTLLINTRERRINITIPSIAGAQVDYVDTTTGWGPPATARVLRDEITLTPYAVEALTLE